ncbi:prolipoprotein diacylglyceryl transferase [Collimonas antrihumi]|uniref:prolipoprotein diacylglyceryl transferase n=1 Tax=Collimonas antrihumi TaxID=1940615 RepID=UPI001B8BF57F|nr:prolipoprotein diacylglyceryl transferase family protein [Collimonas antrihumi]
MKTVVFSSTTAHLIHLVFEWAAIASGVQLYRWQRARQGLSGILEPGQYAVIIGCILGAAIGNKLVFWMEFPQLWASSSLDINLWMSGQSIVGGLLGGLCGVEIAKKLIGSQRSTGDNFVLPLMLGTAIGRIGCFLAGLHDGTYGVPTHMPWGVDFGDGISRHPTQMYDILFVLIWGGAILFFQKRWRESPGLVFKFYLSGYLLWRLLVDGIKPVPYEYAGGLSGIQIMCLLALLCYLPFVIKQFLNFKKNAPLFQ